jgi:hypothetical protein
MVFLRGATGHRGQDNKQDRKKFHIIQWIRRERNQWSKIVIDTPNISIPRQINELSYTPHFCSPQDRIAQEFVVDHDPRPSANNRESGTILAGRRAELAGKF